MIQVLCGLILLGWVGKKLWERSYRRRTGRPASELWETPVHPEPHPKVHDEATICHAAGIKVHAPKTYRDGKPVDPLT